MYGATIGKVGILDIESTTNQACCACLPVNGVFNEYLFYFLMSQKEAFQKRGEGGAQPNISKEKIVATPFPLPPIAEQHRIVVAIETAFKEIDSIATTLECR
jgi:type I restriction enzyme S subunit